MRGPQDKVIDAEQSTSEGVAVSTPQTPGGKALFRMLQLLEARGFY